MSLKKIKLNLFFILSIGFFCSTYAEDERNYFSVSAAVFDILQKDKTAFEGRAEFQLYQVDWVVKPITGVMANTSGALHFFAGIFIDIPITSFIYISPSFAPGIYYKNNSKDLDFLLEFRTQLEVAIRLDSDIRVGLSFNHISNASLGNTNPGVESLALTYHFPF